ncbi:CgeB family protein [Saccharicrinis sp. GN24d3]|uniref:CgeB family protein n=1 Tax=Saccharicrinis sp. GN24d3 TaxID=3458416 RepID=UPI004036A393
MNILYIGQYTNGTTSKMRADQLKQILGTSPLGDRGVTFHIINTHIPFFQTHRIWRSLGFRYKGGPLISKVNKYVLNQLSNSTTQQFNLIWVDKAIFLTPQTTQYLKSLTDKLVHFTPDMAFYGNQSVLFNKNIKLYDYLITTKTAEVKEYTKYIENDQLIVTTQGFDKSLHQPVIPFNEKKASVAFIGLCEPSREEMLQMLIDHQIKIKLAGKGWSAFVEKNKNSTYLNYVGEGLFSKDYTRFISSAYFSIGMLSKNFPELHTTRTFEIPACGTALITERNEETISFFTEEEAIFYDSAEEMIEKIKYYQNHLDELEVRTHKGTERVHKDGRDYESILRSVLHQINILK